MAKTQYRSGRTFAVAFLLALCVLGFGGACVLIECNTRRTTYGRVDFGVTYSTAEGVPELCLTDSGEPLWAYAPEPVWQTLADAPLRLIGWVFRGEVAVLTRGMSAGSEK